MPVYLPYGISLLLVCGNDDIEAQYTEFTLTRI